MGYEKYSRWCKTDNLIFFPLDCFLNRKNIEFLRKKIKEKNFVTFQKKYLKKNFYFTGKSNKFSPEMIHLNNFCVKYVKIINADTVDFHRGCHRRRPMTEFMCILSS